MVLLVVACHSVASEEFYRLEYNVMQSVESQQKQLHQPVIRSE
jgi:hypothetical protein